MTWLWLDKFFSLPTCGPMSEAALHHGGDAGFAMLLPLAITSTAGWVRRLGFVKWQRLHRLIYFARWPA
jgi:methionine sulfoxide reductase heme-binding subunit